MTTAPDPSSRPSVRVNLRSGHLEIRAAEGASLAVEGKATLRGVSGAGEYEVVPDAPSARIRLSCPSGTNFIIGTDSAGIEATGVLGNVRITTRSGKVKLAEAGQVDMRSGSGKIDVGTCREVRVRTGSGDVAIGKAGRADVSSASGKVYVNQVGRTQVQTATGAIEVRVRGDASIRSMSGSVSIGVLDGLKPAVRQRSISGKLRNDCPAGDDLRVEAQTVSGEIEVFPA